MPVNNKHTAPTTTAISIYTFNDSTKFLNVQNTDLVINIRAGFSVTNLITDGIQIKPGETWPVPLDGDNGQLFIVSEGVELVDKIILIRG